MAVEATFVTEERTPVTHRDQFYKEDGTFYTSDDVYEGTAYVYDENSDTPNDAIYTESLVLDEVFFDAAQTDSGWRQDDVGYNFKWTAPSFAFPLGGHSYRVEIYVETVSDSNFEASAPHRRSFYVKTKGSRT